MQDAKPQGHTYTIGEISAMSGATERALRHYEDLGLLSPERDENGYRRYRDKDVERLQQVLLLRACGMELSAIRGLLESPGYDAAKALENHLKILRARQRELEALVETVEKTIATMRGQETMTNEERFRGLKEQAIAENEKAYGEEARERYGDEAVDAANERVRAMSEEDWNEMRELEQAIIRQLKAAIWHLASCTSRTRGSATTTTRVQARGRRSSWLRRCARSWTMASLEQNRAARKGKAAKPKARRCSPQRHFAGIFSSLVDGIARGDGLCQLLALAYM